jgi:NAD(P)-dependent dehydrogenase (short-subunit alcohol dehydrogenase family)
MIDPLVAPDRTFAGKTVLVAGHGPSARCIAGAARERGARVGLASAGNEQAPLEDVEVFPATFAAEDEVDRLIDGVVDRLVRLDVIIIVVATGPLGGIDDMSLAQWQRAAVDPLRQLFWLARRAIEEMLAGGAGGRVVVVLDPGPGGERNEIVEQALRSFARGFCREYGRRALACNVVLPVLAPTGTARTQAQTDAMMEHVLFLAGPASSFINGETLRVELKSQTEEANARAE